MKATGIVRKVDELGRVVLPIELRRNLDINEKDALEIYVDEDRIILKSMNLPVFFVIKRWIPSFIRERISAQTVWQN